MGDSGTVPDRVGDFNICLGYGKQFSINPLYNKKMSDQENKFLRQLRLTLLIIIGPFILATTGAMVNDHFKIKESNKHIIAIERDYVSKEVILLYMDEMRKANEILSGTVIANEEEADEELKLIRAKMDDMMDDLYDIKKRGGFSKDLVLN